MTPAPDSLDQSFPLQDVACQLDDLASPLRRDAGPLGKLQSADRLVGKSAQDASADRRRSIQEHTNPIRHDGGR
jgi:hypothetical protein